jgi:uncharacterized membrane protein YkoI
MTRAARFSLILTLLMLSSAPVLAQAPAIDIMTAIETATERFEGRVIAADLGEGRDGEPDAVYALRLLTESGDVIEIRIDAAEGRIIEVNGRGLVDARKSPRGF